MKSSFLGILILMTGCSKQVQTLVTPENVTSKPSPLPSPIKVSKSNLIEQLNRKGTLQGVQTSQIDHAYEVVDTTSDERYFLNEGRVVSSSRNPKQEEQSLMYWRNLFKGKLYRESELIRQVQGHQRPLLQLACDELGQGVLYDPNHEQVMRVFYYESP